jgi:hypothetical protein
MFLEESDTNTKFFHLQACHRGRKNFIEQLEDNGVAVVDVTMKAQLVFDHFNAILGASEPHAHGMNITTLGLPCHSLGLDYCFSEDEVWSCQGLAPKVSRDVGYGPTSKPSSGHARSPGSRTGGFRYWVGTTGVWSSGGEIIKCLAR